MRKSRLVRRLAVGAVVLLAGCSLGNGSESGITDVGIVVGVLGVVVTGVIGISGFSAYTGYRSFQRIREEHLATVEKEMESLREKYRLSSLKLPEEIVADARSEYVPLIENLRRALEAKAGDLEERIGRREDEVRRSQEGLAQRLALVQGEIAHLPDVERIMRAVDEKFKPHVELQERIFRRVLDAFLQISSLSDTERQRISRALAIDDSES